MKSEDDKIDTTGVEQRDDDGVVNGVLLTYVGSSADCIQDPTQKYNLKVNITCQSDNDDLTFVSASGDACTPQINYLSKKGCPVFTLDQFTQFLNDYYYLWGAALIVLGFFLIFFGNKFVNVVIFTIVTLGVFVILGGLFFNLFLTKVKADWAKWLALVAIILVSAVAGYYIQKLRKYSVAIVAAWGGVMLGFIITTAFVIENKGAFYATIVGCGIVSFFVALKIEKTVVIIVTAFIGSYSLIRGVSLYAGGFPNESELHNEISDGAVDWDTFDKKFYIYLGAIFVSTCIGIIY